MRVLFCNFSGGVPSVKDVTAETLEKAAELTFAGQYDLATSEGRDSMAYDGWVAVSLRGKGDVALPLSAAGVVTRLTGEVINQPKKERKDIYTVLREKELPEWLSFLTKSEWLSIFLDYLTGYDDWEIGIASEIFMREGERSIFLVLHPVLTENPLEVFHIMESLTEDNLSDDLALLEDDGELIIELSWN